MPCMWNQIFTKKIFTVTNPQPNPPIWRSSLPRLLTSFYSSDYCSLTETELPSKCQEVLQEILISEEEASNLEKLTRKLSPCVQWSAHRSGRLTTSNFHGVYHTNVSNPSVTLIRKIMNYMPIVETPATKWGKSKEETTLNEYQGSMQKHHSGFLVRHSGLVVNFAYPTLGASPDGVTDCPSRFTCNLFITNSPSPTWWEKS